jgi:DNA mismatch endonuclease (patch repair protein)
MADVFSKAKRSEIMSRIRSRGNRDTELALARLLRANGIKGWRRHLLIRATVESRRRKRGNTSSGLRPSFPQSGEGAARHPSTLNPRLAVRPDFVFLKSRAAIFVDGCFWHGCPKHATWPAHRAAWWRRKIEGNQKRDRLVNRSLRKAGWKVARIWECDLAKRPKTCIRRIQRALGG